MSEEIDVDAYVADEKARLDRFARGWKENMKASPKQFPAKMPPGEWDEQMRADEE
jgi:hypothetical protein